MKGKFMAIVLSLLTLGSYGMMSGCGDEGSGGREISIFSRPVVERVEGQRKDWNDVSSFICYYGDFCEEQKNFDVAIMHSSVLFADPDAKAKVAELNETTYTISYITIGEDDSLNVADGLGEGGYASYYVYENGFPKMNTNWGSYFVDASNPVWQDRIIKEAGEILSYGVDGLFLDTLDTVDVRPESIGGLTQLIKRLHETYPEAKLVANRGFNLLKYISPYISGLMFESFNTTYDFTLQKVVDLEESAVEYNKFVACNVINSVRRYDYFPIFCLDYCNEYEFDYMPQEYYNNSWRYDFIPYCTYDILLGIPCDAGVTPTSTRGDLALSALSDGGMGGSNADTTNKNFAYVENGAKITVDSSYPGYGTDALNDGWYATNDNHNQANWARESWASMDAAMDHWVAVEFTTQKSLSSIVIHWANDNGTYYSPQELQVQIWNGEAWETVATWTNEPEIEGDDYLAFLQTTEISLDNVTAQKVRIFQPKGKGCADRFGDPVRQNIMWVSEIEIF